MLQELTWRQELHVDDVKRIRQLVATTGMFSIEEIQVAGELLEERLEKGESTGYHFLLAEHAGQVIGYACFGLIPFTDQRFDLYWIAIDPNYQNQGIGKLLLQQTEKIIQTLGGAYIYAETSGRDLYLPTHHFYQRNGYQKLAELADFYRDGDSKVIYGKRLDSTN